jgi:hypothetical protein
MRPSAVQPQRLRLQGRQTSPEIPGLKIPEVSTDTERSINSMQGRGAPLPDSERDFFESRIGQDFSQVRVHTDSQAVQTSQELSARAFTVGSDIAFDQGEYQPGTDEGRRLLAHELTHVVQQGGSGELVAREPEAEESQAEPGGKEPPANEQPASEADNEGADTQQSTATADESDGAAADTQAPGQNGEDLGITEQLESQGDNVPQPESGGQPDQGTADTAEGKLLADAAGETALLDMVAGMQGEGTEELESQKGEAETVSGEATATMGEVQSGLGEVGSANMALGEGEGTGEFPTAESGQSEIFRQVDPAAQQTMQADQATAESMLNDFFSYASGQIEQITAMSQEIGAPVQAAADAAKATIQTEVEQQKSQVETRTTEAIAQAEADAETLRGEINAQYDQTISNIKTVSSQAREKVQLEYQSSLERLVGLEATQLTEIDALYQQVNADYKAAGQRVGTKTQALGDEKEQAYRSKVRSPKVDDSFLDGPLTDNRHEARADAARDTTKEFKKSLLKEADSQAAKVQETKLGIIQQVKDLVTQYKTALLKHQDTMLKNLQSQEAQTLQQAADMKTQLLQSADLSLETTLASLREQQVAQMTLLDNEGMQQLASIDSMAEQGIASLQQAMAQAAADMLAGIQSLQQSVFAVDGQPDIAALGGTLAQTTAQIDQAVTTTQEQVNGQIELMVTGLNEAALASTEALVGIGEQALESINQTAEGFSQTVADLNVTAGEGFARIAETHTNTTNQSVDTAVQGYQATLTKLNAAFSQLNTGLKTKFADSVSKLEEGLMAAVHGQVADVKGLVPLIEEKAEEAAGKVQPRWKSVLKWVLIIAIIVVAAIVVGPFLVGALGAVLGSTLGTIAAGAIVGGLAGAAIQVVNNWYENKDLLDGVGTAFLVGFIGGALGAGIGMALQGPISALAGKVTGEFAKAGIRFAAETAADFGLNIGTEFVIKGELTWEAVGTALLMSVAMNGFNKIPRVKGLQDRFQGAGARFGSSVKGPDISIDVDTRTPTDTDAGGSGGTGGKAADTDTGSTGGKAADTDTGGTGGKAADTDTGGTGGKAADTDADSTSGTTAEPKPTTGKDIAAQRGYPDPPEGYHWAKSGDDVILRRNPGKAGELPALEFDPASGNFSFKRTPGPDQQMWTPGKQGDPVKNSFGHWQKHGGEFPELQNAKQYVEATTSFVNNPPAGARIKTRANGDIIIYDPNTNTFAVSTSDGVPKTMFKPDPAKHGYPTNLDYFNAQ